MGRITKQPYIDGPEGLFAQAEGARAVEPCVDGTLALGLGLAALTGGLGVVLNNGQIYVKLTYLDSAGTYCEDIAVLRLTSAAEVTGHRATIIEQLDQSLAGGADLIRQAPELLPQLRFGDLAKQQMSALAKADSRFPSLLRHLRTLDRCAREWQGGRFEPALNWSPESEATLNHAHYGPMRDFPTPEGFDPSRWSHHTKFADRRLYFRFDAAHRRVLIGYFGVHLSTINF